MAGYKYDVIVAQFEDHGAPHPDTHMFFMQIQEEQLDTITVIMKKLSLKAQ